MKNWLKQLLPRTPTKKIVISPDSGIHVSLEELILLRRHAKEINLVNPQKVMTDRVGGYLSKFKGRGIDFEEVRTYQPGDDVRLIDWRVTARSGKPHTKIFHEERERPVFVIVDMSINMFFGTKVAFKSVIAAKIAALIAWATVKNGDRIGGIVYGGDACREFRPKSRSQGILPLLKFLGEATQTAPHQQKGQFEQALLKLRNVVRPGSLIFILSDFADINEVCEKHLGLLSKHNQIIANFIYDPLEQTPPPANQYNISDGTHRLSMDTTDEDFCRIYRQMFQNRLEKLTAITKKYQIPLIPFKTNDSPLKVLKKGLASL